MIYIDMGFYLPGKGTGKNILRMLRGGSYGKVLERVQIFAANAKTSILSVNDHYGVGVGGISVPGEPGDFA